MYYHLRGSIKRFRNTCEEMLEAFFLEVYIYAITDTTIYQLPNGPKIVVGSFSMAEVHQFIVISNP